MKGSFRTWQQTADAGIMAPTKSREQGLGGTGQLEPWPFNLRLGVPFPALLIGSRARVHREGPESSQTSVGRAGGGRGAAPSRCTCYRRLERPQ